MFLSLRLGGRLNAMWSVALGLSFAIFLVPDSALAQTAAPLAPNASPDYRTVDENQVDFGAGTYMGDLPHLSIGQPGKGGMSWALNPAGSDTYTAYMTATSFPSLWGGDGPVPWGANVTIDNRTFSFFWGSSYATSGSYTEIAPIEGDTLTCGPGGTVFTDRHGGTATFAMVCLAPSEVGSGDISSRTFPNGEVWTYNYSSNRQAISTPSYGSSFNNGGVLTPPLSSVTNKFGYMIKYNYSSSGGLPSVYGINLAVEYCNPYAVACSTVNKWPSIAFSSTFIPPQSVLTSCWEMSTGATTVTSSNTGTITDAENNTTTFFNDLSKCNSNGPFETTTITAPSGKVKTLYYSMLLQVCGFAGQDLSDLSQDCLPNPPQWVVTGYSNGINTWDYSYEYDGSITTYLNTISVRTDPQGHTRKVEVLPDGQAILNIDELGRKTTIIAPGPSPVIPTTASENEGRISSITWPEGNVTTYGYDARNNLTTVTRAPATGSSLSSLVTTYAFPSTCTSALTCNYPTSVTDPKGNVTTYAYDPNSGQVASVTGPAVGGVQPQTRYTYTAETAKALNSSNVLTAEPTSVWLLTAVSSCATSAATGSTPPCAAGAADELKSIISYSGEDNLLPAWSEVDPNGLQLASGYGYDIYGNRIWVSDPESAVTSLGHVTAKTYDADRRVIFDIAANPSIPSNIVTGRVATKYTYDADGNVIEVDKGSTTQSSGSDFSALESTTFTYDNAERKIQATVYNGTTSTSPLAVTQYAYDTDSRLQCTAVRQNTAVFGSLPSSACTQSAGSSLGPDRITEFSYDAAGQKLVEQRGVGTGVLINYGTYTYGQNGEVLTVKDANGNLTTNTYDGFDRLTQVNFPSTTKGAGTSDSTDYEAYQYDADSNRTQLRKRDGNTIAYYYDALNRLTTRQENATYYNFAYDLANRRVSALFGSGIGVNSGPGVTFTYDAASRKTSETTNGLKLSFTYDLASNRASMTWPDSQGTTYTFDGANRFAWVGNSAVGMGYGLDSLGRLAVLERHATTSPVAWDNADRMTSLAHNLASAPVTYTFGYTPASQVSTATVSNATYQWTGPTSTINTTPDGLNRDTSATYDANGNLLGDGTRTFTYDFGNRLLSANGGGTSMTLTYDPLDRLETTTVSGTTTTYLWDGGDLVATYNGSTLTERFVHGPGTDDPVIWFSGSGMAADNASYMIADRQGSIIATTNTAGTPAATYTYDPYGNPSTWSVPTFGYTGQIALQGTGLWYYKARVYDPLKGHFLQTDPVGMKDNLNLYAYVDEDPFNGEDPSGLKACEGPPDSEGKPTRVPNCRDDPSTEKTNPDGRTVTQGTEVSQVVVNGTRRDRQDPPSEMPYIIVDGPDGLPQFHTISPKDLQPFQWRCGSKSGQGYIINPAVYANAVSGGHFHPDGYEQGPSEDDGSSVAAGKPQNVSSSAGTVVVEYSQYGYRERLIDGSWGESATDSSKTIGGFNKGGGSGSAAEGCKIGK